MSEPADPCEDELSALASALWRGLPLLWQEELRAFRAHAARVGQDLTPEYSKEALELWLARVQARPPECPIAGAGCDKPRGERFCARHRGRSG